MNFFVFPSRRALRLIGALALITPLAACTFNSEGRSKDVSAFSISKPDDLVGLKKGDLISKMGLPAATIHDEKGREYWQYNNASRYYILMFGQKESKNLLVRFANDAVDEVFLVDKGSGTDVFTVGF